MPFLAAYLLVHIYNIEVLVLPTVKPLPQCIPGTRASHHPELVAVVAHKNGPMLRRVRVLIDLLRNHLAKSGLLGKPLAGKSRDRVPANLDDPRCSVDIGLGWRYDAGSVAQTERVLELQLLLQKLLLALGQAVLAVSSSATHPRL